LEDGPGEEDGTEVARVRQPARERPDEEEEEDLDGADPGDVRRWTVEERGVVGLEDAVGVYEAPSDDELATGTAGERGRARGKESMGVRSDEPCIHDDQVTTKSC
jgi:hypothetical protein